MITLSVLYLLFSIVAGIVLAEFSLHLHRLPLRYRQQVTRVVESMHGHLQDVSVVAKDGAVLKGWFVTPAAPNGSAVILLHGITDNREGMAGYAQLMLKNGYSVLLPDARVHGESGGKIATYGLLEADDTHRWVSWLEEQQHPACVYGLGESYGAALLLQSLAAEDRFCAVVAESAFSQFTAVAPERAAYFIGMSSSPFMSKLLTPAVWIALGYTRAFYGLNLAKVNPADAVHHSKTPVLLIHGEEDVNILPWHSKYIAEKSPEHVQLWMVPHVNHTATWQLAPRQFETRVLGWFQNHTVSTDAPAQSPKEKTAGASQ